MDLIKINSRFGENVICNINKFDIIKVNCRNDNYYKWQNL